MRKCGQLLLIALLITLNAAELDASIKDRVFSLHLDLYGVQPALNDSAQVWLFSPYYGGDLQYMIAPQTGLVLSVRSGKIYNDSVSTSIFKFNNDRANRVWKVTSIAIGPKFYLNQRTGTTPYFVTRLEMLLWSIKTYPGEVPIVIADKEGSPRDYKATELGFTAGFGLEQLIADRIAFSISAEFTYMTGLGADFAQWVRNSRSKAILQFGAGLSFHFGGKRKSLMKQAAEEEQEHDRITRKVFEVDDGSRGDSVFVDKSKTAEEAVTADTLPKHETIPDSDEDRDGVADRLDKCAATPSGATVDRDGCPTDSDSDGVFNGIDLCPETAKVDVSHIDRTGCTSDSDLDGVPDYRDRCPNTSAHSIVDSTGCLLDADKDGVENSLDQCPETPDYFPVDMRGCPDRERIFVDRVFHRLFDAGEVKLNSERTAALDSVITLLKMFADVTVAVYGYTDDVGPDDANLLLSRKRADAVKSYLVSAGLDKGRIQSTGRGESNFMASNRTRRGRELNRRIELEFKMK